MAEVQERQQAAQQAQPGFVDRAANLVIVKPLDAATDLVFGPFREADRLARVGDQVRGQITAARRQAFSQTLVRPWRLLDPSNPVNIISFPLAELRNFIAQNTWARPSANIGLGKEAMRAAQQQQQQQQARRG